MSEEKFKIRPLSAYSGWQPKMGRYRNIMGGNITVTEYFADRDGIPRVLKSGDEVDFYARECRAHARAGFMIHGWLVPITHFEADGEGYINVPVVEDPQNPNVISDDLIIERVAKAKSMKALKSFVDPIESYVTVGRILEAAVQKDKPNSYINYLEERVRLLRGAYADINSGGKAPVDDERKAFLTGVLKRKDD